ncbi:MAG: recombinase family protein, partial [Actinomycetota bacterium]|nr:recombinase family protein [Actinomycetota bacterium]
SVKKILEREGIPTPRGGQYWDKKLIREIVLNDVYKPHTYDEVRKLTLPEVAARLDPKKCYGIWWFNRRRSTRKQVAEYGPNGRSYRRSNPRPPEAGMVASYPPQRDSTAIRNPWITHGGCPAWWWMLRFLVSGGRGLPKLFTGT